MMKGNRSCDEDDCEITFNLTFDYRVKRYRTKQLRLHLLTCTRSQRAAYSQQSAEQRVKFFSVTETAL
jgi:hypothetical protein